MTKKYTVHWQKILDQKQLIECIKRELEAKADSLKKKLEAEEKRLAVMEYDFEVNRHAIFCNGVEMAVDGIIANFTGETSKA